MVLSRQASASKRSLSEYRDKLINFNARSSYKDEMVFMRGRLALKSGEKLLDYGCGIGTFVGFCQLLEGVKVYGYDKYEYFGDAPHWFIRETFFKMDKVSMLHCLQCIEDPLACLANIRENILQQGGEIHILTPDLDFLRSIGKDDIATNDHTTVAYFDTVRLADILRRAGFMDVEVEKYKTRLYAKAIA